MLDSVFNTIGSTSAAAVGLCFLTAIALGLIVAAAYMYRNSCSKNMVITVALLPVIVQAVIFVVNGSLGAGVAVMGAFSLVRFRSVPGGARDIISIFFSMAVGICVGMGYLAYALIFAATGAISMLALEKSRFGERDSRVKSLKIVIPEDTDYTSLFDDLFEEYARSAKLERVRTTNLGSLYELQYTVHLRNFSDEKALLDHMRQRNGNLSISSRPAGTASEL